MSSPPLLDQAQYQQLYSQYQAGVSQLQFFTNQESQVTGMIEELSRNSSTINGLMKFSPDSDIIIPLGSTVFIKSKLRGMDEVLINIGSDVFVPSTFEEANAVLEERIGEMRQVLEKLSKDRTNLESIVANLEAQLSQYQKQMA